MATQTIAQLRQQTEHMIDTANQAADAVHEFARAANGNAGHVIPAPSAYDVLGNLTSLLGRLEEVAKFLPVGLRNSLTDPRISVGDRDFNTGKVRDPSAQVERAAAHLAELHTALEAAYAAAAAAQVAINGQGWDEVVW